MSLIALYKSLSIYLPAIKAGPKVKIGVGKALGAGLGVEAQEIGAKELLFLVKALARLPASLLSPWFIRKFWQRLQ